MPIHDGKFRFVVLTGGDLAAVAGGNATAFVKGTVGGFKLAEKLYGQGSWEEKRTCVQVMRSYFRGDFDPR